MSRFLEPGKVYLVGAGPGAPDLITVRGLQLIRSADVVVYDRLIDAELLDEIPPQTERIYVGKAASRHTMPQAEINRLLVDLALQGKSVVRLKGGDPFVFGRGGEECVELALAGVPFEVVPGISSAVSAPAFAGIPVTHRGVSNAFTVVTGHTCVDPDSDLDWEALSRIGTLVVLMGLGQLPCIVENLVAHGRSPETPVAIVGSGSTNEQVVVAGTLADITERAAEVSSPATIVVGEVVNLRHLLDWFEPAASAASSFPFVAGQPLARHSRFPSAFVNAA